MTFAATMKGRGERGELFFPSQRRRFILSASFLLACIHLLPIAAASTDSSSSDADVDDADHRPPPSSDEDEPCALYLAPSSIPDSGLGTYTAVPLESGDEIGPPEPVLHVFDWPFHSSPDEANAALLSDYDWDGADYLGHLEARKVQTVIPGMGAAINSHPGLHNVVMGHPAIDSAGLRRHAREGDGEVDEGDVPGDPGVGAFTYYHSLRSLAAGSIPAGSELFAHYSDPYFIDRTAEFGMIPLAQDFDDADRIVAKFHRSMKTMMAAGGGGMSEEVLEDLWGTIVGGFGEDVRTARLRAALPETLGDVRTAAEMGPTGSAHLSLPSHVRDREWLERRGMCADNVRPGRSAIAQAGRGAFAARSIAEGDVVLPLPLLHVNRTLLDMRTLRKDPDFEGRLLKGKDVVGRQLLLNYCLGHEESSVLLYPYSTGSNGINHGAGYRANVRLRWHVPRGDAAAAGDEGVEAEEGGKEEGIGGFHHPEWLDLDARGLFGQTRTGLLMELVAIRDIAAGEEILLDYGPGWAKAWEDHVRSWPERGPHGAPTAADDDDSGGAAKKKKRRRYGYPHELDDDKYAPLRTHAEQKDDPYPPNVATACYYNAPGPDDPPDPSAKRRPIRAPGSNGGDPSSSRGGGKTVEVVEVPWNSGGMGELSHPTLRLCRIIGREERVSRTQDSGGDEGRRPRMAMTTTELLYTAIMMPHDGDLPKEERHVVHGIPRDGIALVDRPYASDQHLAGAFRREIGVPDDVFPKAWRDLA